MSGEQDDIDGLVSGSVPTGGLDRLEQAIRDPKPPTEKLANLMSAYRANQDHPRYMRTPEAAAYLGKSTSWLNKSRMTGDGPAYYKLGATVVYRTDDLDSWVESCRRTAVYDHAQRVEPKGTAAIAAAEQIIGRMRGRK